MPLSPRVQTFCLVALLLSPNMTPACAQTAGDGDVIAVIGAGAVATPVYEGSDKFRFLPMPVISFAYKDLVVIQGVEARVNLLNLRLGSDMTLRAGPLARFRIGRDESDDPDLKGLGDVGAAAELGGFARLEAGQAWLQIGLGKDVAGGHEGLVAEAETGIRFDLSRALGATFSASTAWADDRFMQRNFGIDAGQAARSRLRRFDAKAGIKHVGTTATLDYRLSRRWGVGISGGYRRLIGDAADSPMVRDRGTPDQLFGMAFLSYVL